MIMGSRHACAVCVSWNQGNWTIFVSGNQGFNVVRLAVVFERQEMKLLILI
jgi:hypothetical protein